jgi:uncharacterized membrane-anchored protein
MFENINTRTSDPRVRNRFRLLIVLVLVQAIFLIGIALSFYAVGWYGKEIRLQTAPIDPRDLVYGDYVVLNYEISQIKATLWKGAGKLPRQGDILYVVVRLDKRNAKGTFEAVAAYDHKPSINPGEVILIGRSGYTFDDMINVKYGLETYYVPQNTGKALEEQVGQFVAKVKVASSGRAILEKIEISANK